MWGINKKKFLITLVFSIVIWFISVLIQGFTGFNAILSIFGPSCQLTGFPIATCLFNGPGQFSGWMLSLLNIFFWFWVIHLFWGWFSKPRSEK